MNNPSFVEPLMAAVVSALLPTGLILWRLKKLEDGQADMTRRVAEYDLRLQTFWIEKWPSVGILEVRVAGVENVVRDINAKIDHLGYRVNSIDHHFRSAEDKS